MGLPRLLGMKVKPAAWIVLPGLRLGDLNQLKESFGA